MEEIQLLVAAREESLKALAEAVRNGPQMTRAYETMRAILAENESQFREVQKAILNFYVEPAIPLAIFDLPAPRIDQSLVSFAPVEAEPSLADLYFEATSELRETQAALRRAKRQARQAEKKAAQLELESAERARRIQELEAYLLNLSLTGENTIDYRDLPPPNPSKN